MQEEILPTITITTDQSAIDYILDAQILIDLGEYDKSIMLLNVIAQRYKGDNKEVEARILGGLARNYLSLGLDRKAMEFWQDAIETSQGLEDNSYLQAIFYSNMSIACINLGETEKAHKNLLKSLEMYPLISVYPKLSKLVLDKDKDFELSESYLASGLSIINSDTIANLKPYLNDRYMESLHHAFILEGYAYHYFVMEDFQKSLKKYEEVLAIAQEIKRTNLQVEILKKIGYLYQSMGNLEKSTYYLTKYISLNDSLTLVKSNALSIPIQNFIHEQDKEDPKQIRTNTAYRIIIFLAFVSLFVFIIIKISKRRKEDVEGVKNSEKEYNKAIDLILPPKTEKELLLKLKEFEASEEFLDKNMSFSTLVGYLNSNSKYLRKILKNDKNTDYNNYINKLRIQYIVNKLKSDPDYLNYKISYLAEECGFSSHSKFSASFKNVTSVSPSVFISNLANNKS